MRADTHTSPPDVSPAARLARPVARQRGAALLSAMIIVTIVATLAAGMVWQQWRAVQVETAERGRVQAAWILSGALDWAGQILKEDLKTGRPTALTEPWATPLAEARLSTFLAANKSSTDDGPEAFLSGSIADAQARYNLTNLVNSDPKIHAQELETLERLCSAVGLGSAVAQSISTGLATAAGASGSTDAGANGPLLPTVVSQLTWLGLDEATVKTLEPYVILLPNMPPANVIPVNVNTASREVLMAAVKGLDAATAERVLQARQRAPFRDKRSFQTLLPSLDTTDANIDVRSSYFEVRGRIRLQERVLVERSLVQRVSVREVVTLQRERIASLEQAGG